VAVPSDFDARLVAAQGGDDEAVAAIYRSFRPGIARYLGVRLGRDAEDVEAEVWLAVAERLHAFTGDEGAFRGWLYSIARRRIADHLRTRARRRTEPAPIEVLDRPAAGDPESLFFGEGSGEAAARFVARVLPADQAEVVMLRVVAGLEVAEVAELMGKQPGTVRVLQHRALARLEAALGRETCNAERIWSD
jgi:RNA polymerase sigma-70 factor (ECF subfamily)